MNKKFILNALSLLCKIVSCIAQAIFLIPFDRYPPILIPTLFSFLILGFILVHYIRHEQLYLTNEDMSDPKFKVLNNLSSFFSALLFCLIFALVLVK